MDLLKLKNNKSGYTLFELLISFGIFTILLGIMVFGFRSAKSIETFKETTSLFVSQIKKMQNNALTGQEIIYGGDKIVPDGGYGLHIDLGPPGVRYILFADTTSVNINTGSCIDTIGNQRFDNDNKYIPNCVTETDFEIIELAADIKIAVIEIEDSTEIKKLIVKAKLGDYFYDNIKNNLLDFDLAFQNFKPFPYVGLMTENIYRDPDNQNYDSKKFNTIKFYFLHEGLEICRKITVSGSSGMVQEESTDLVNCK